ncbi:hypothetical protein BXU10_13995 [Flavobacterium sp. LM4]|nr:hypothetical protein BXU10_13995 [Flavobacterium sp. LM4]
MFSFASVFSIFIIIPLLLSSCAVSGLSSEPMQFNKDYSSDGIVVGSITFTQEKARFNSYFTYFHSLDSIQKVSKENSRELQISPDQTWKLKHSGELNKGRTYLFAFKRKPGKYEVSNVRLATVGMGYAVRDNQISGFSIPFEVKKGQITYIGEINLNEFALKNDTLISLKDNYERDINAIKTKQPTVNWNLAKKSEIKINYITN